MTTALRSKFKLLLLMLLIIHSTFFILNFSTAAQAAVLTDIGSGMVTDSTTGLTWQQDEGGGMTWGNALSYCEGLSLGGHDDWRLPNVKELESLTDDSRNNPAIDTSFFPNAFASYYVSSTTDADGPAYAWYVGFSDGDVVGIYKGYNYYVRCVRGGQSGYSVISISPTSKEYDSVVVDTTSDSQTFTISNSGTADLIVSPITITGGDSGMFTLDKGAGDDGTCGATPKTIAPDGNCTVTVAFKPTSTGGKTTTLRITSNDPATPDKDIALSGTGVFPITYTVTYNSNTSTGGSVPTDGSSYANGDLVTVLGNINSLVKTGYTFAGWNTAANGTGTSQAAASTFNMGSANVTLFAKWTINNYTVTFNSNDGSAVSSQNVAYNTTATTPTTPAKSGYTFAGWYSDSALTSGFAFTTPITGNTTLYAKWAPVTTPPANNYTVSYNSNGGSAISSQSVVSNTTATAPAVPTKTGYTFAGWYSNTGLTSAFAFTTAITGDTTLYAKWTVSTFLLNFLAGANGTLSGPAGYSNQTINYGANAASVTALPATGYHFVNWTGTGGFVTTSANPLTMTNVTKSQSITANFAADTVVIPHDGIVTGSGKTAPDIADALAVLNHFFGVANLDATQRIHADVAPLGTNGLPVGDGKVDLADVIIILRRTIGIGNW